MKLTLAVSASRSSSYRPGHAELPSSCLCLLRDKRACFRDLSTLALSTSRLVQLLSEASLRLLGKQLATSSWTACYRSELLGGCARLPIKCLSVFTNLIRSSAMHLPTVETESRIVHWGHIAQAILFPAVFILAIARIAILGGPKSRLDTYLIIVVSCFFLY